MSIIQAGKTINDKFIDWCVGYMRNEDADTEGITVFTHPVYRLAVLASKGPGQQKERLGSVFSRHCLSNEYLLQKLDDIQIDGKYIGTALLKHGDRDKRSLSDRFISAKNTFHHPEDPLVRTLDESFVIAKLLEYRINPGGSMSLPDIRPAAESDMSEFPPALKKLNEWIRRIAMGGSSTASVAKYDNELVISVNAPSEFADEIISVMQETKDLWIKRPRRPEEFMAEIRQMTAEEDIDIPEEVSDGTEVLTMGKRESEEHFRQARQEKEDSEFELLDTLSAPAESEERNDLANNRYGMDPFRIMNVNEIFFHSTLL